jgi:hypothetical protein
VLAEVAAVLDKSAPEVRTRLVTALTEREMVKRVDLLDKALVKRQSLFIETKKLKPKMLCVLNEDGTSTPVPAPVTSDEAKKFAKAVKDAKEALDKFDATLEKAFSTGDKDAFEKLAKQVSGKVEEPASE